MNENPRTNPPLPAPVSTWRSWRRGGSLPLAVFSTGVTASSTEVDVTTGAAAVDGPGAVALSSLPGGCSQPIAQFEYVEWAYATDQGGGALALMRSGPSQGALSDRTALDGRPFPRVTVSAPSDARDIVTYSPSSPTGSFQNKVVITELQGNVKLLDVSSNAIVGSSGSLCGSGAGQQPFWAPYRSAPDEFGGFVYVLHTGGCQPGAEIAISILVMQPDNILRLQTAIDDPVSPGKIIIPTGVGNIPIDLRARAIFQTEATGVKYALKLGGTPAKVLQRFLYVTAAGPDTAIEHHPAPCQSGACRVVGADKDGIDSGGGPIPVTCIVVEQPLGFHTYDLNPCILSSTGTCTPNPNYKQAIRRVFLDDAIFEVGGGASNQVCELGLDVALTEGYAYVVAPASGKLLKFNEADLQNGDPNFVVAPVAIIPLTTGSFPADAVVAGVPGAVPTGQRRVFVPLMGTDKIAYVKVSDNSSPLGDQFIDSSRSALIPRNISARGTGEAVFTANFANGSVTKIHTFDLSLARIIHRSPEYAVGKIPGKIFSAGSATHSRFGSRLWL